MDVIVGLYDSFGGFIGYKAGDEWTLSRNANQAKIHPLREFLDSSEEIFDTLVTGLNGGYLSGFIREQKERFDDKQTLAVVIHGSSSGIGLAKIELSRPNGYYEINGNNSKTLETAK